MKTKTSKTQHLSGSYLDTYELVELQNLAVDLACQTFDDPSQAHVDAVQERLVWNARHGLDTHGAVTLH